MKTNFKKITVMGLVSASLIAGCKKEQSTNQNPASSPVRYQVMDRMQVNNEDGKPRPFNTLPVINDEAVAFGSEALSSGQVTLKNTSSGDLLLNVIANTGEKLTLAQNYAAADGFASGTVYYALKNN
jgi:hypothetical protein